MASGGHRSAPAYLRTTSHAVMDPVSVEGLPIIEISARADWAGQCHDSVAVVVVQESGLDAVRIVVEQRRDLGCLRWYRYDVEYGRHPTMRGWVSGLFASVGTVVPRWRPEDEPTLRQVSGLFRALRPMRDSTERR